jgi:FkbM family methyltransferase
VNRVLTAPVRALVGDRFEWAIRHLPRSGRVISRLPNGAELALWSKGDDWVSNQVFWRGWAGYEPETAPLFQRLAARSRVTLDVGAHVGFYGLVAALSNPAGRVVAFEPVSLPFDRLRNHVRLNRLANLECVGAAVGETAGEVDLFFPRDNPLPCSAGLSREFYAPWAEAMDSVRVPCVAIDAFVRERGIAAVDLIKVDVEGYEPAVLRGARETLAAHRPDIVCEVLASPPTTDGLVAVLDPLGYSYFLLTPDGPVRRARPDADPRWMNYLFTTHPDRALA